MDIWIRLARYMDRRDLPRQRFVLDPYALRDLSSEDREARAIEFAKRSGQFTSGPYTIASVEVVTQFSNFLSHLKKWSYELNIVGALDVVVVELIRMRADDDRQDLAPVVSSGRVVACASPRDLFRVSSVCESVLATQRSCRAFRRWSTLTAYSIG